jgi:hypothetical protein
MSILRVYASKKLEKFMKNIVIALLHIQAKTLNYSPPISLVQFLALSKELDNKYLLSGHRNI